MMSLTIPGKETLTIHHLVLDFNGTIAFDGILIPGVEERLRKLSENVVIHVITADTNGSVSSQCANLPVTIHIINRSNQSNEKQQFISSLKPSGTVCIGNGRNDEGMFSIADLAIGVVGREGAATAALLKSDLIIMTIHDGLDLLQQTNRISATLRN